MKKAVVIAGCVLAVAVAAAALWRAPSTENGECGEMITYRIEGTTLYLDGVGAMEDSLAPPEYWENCRDKIRRIVLSDGIETIGVYAFSEFVNLRTVKVPESVESILAFAFKGCDKLRNVQAEGVTTIGHKAFLGCESLKRVTLKSGENCWGAIYDEAFRNCSSLKYVFVNDKMFFADYCFAGCESLKRIQVVVPLNIGKRAFANCRSLTAFPLGNTAEKESDEGYLGYPDMGEGAFLNCTSLETIELPASTREIPASFFSGCTSLTSVWMPDTVTEIGAQAFAGCVSVLQLTVPESVTEIHSSAFSGWTAEQTVYVYRDDLFAEGTFNSGAVVIRRET